MNKKSKIVLAISLIVNVVVLGILVFTYFRSHEISSQKATNLNEEQKVEEIDLAENLQAEDLKTENLATIEEPKEEPKEEPAKETVTKIISLSGKTTSKGVSLSWNANNLGSFDGFKIVKSKGPNPVYPGSEYQYITNKEARAYSWEFTSGSKYHFRVCQYAGGKCVFYSNDIYLDTPEKNNDDDGDYASSVSLSVTEDDEDKYLKWTISGGDAPNGYKVIKSKDKNPEYPDDGYYKYISDEDTKKVKLEGFDSDDEYHFRVCIYKGGSCGAYSNDVKISF